MPRPATRKRYGSLEDTAFRSPFPPAQQQSGFESVGVGSIEPSSLPRYGREDDERNTATSRHRRWGAIALAAVGALAVAGGLDVIRSSGYRQQPALEAIRGTGTGTGSSTFTNDAAPLEPPHGPQETGLPPSAAAAQVDSALARREPPEAAAPLAFTAVNLYHLRDGKPAKDYPWLNGVKLIEPHRNTTLAVAFPREGYEYRWEVRGAGNDGDAGEEPAVVSGRGATCVISVVALDENTVTLEEIDASGAVARRLAETVMVKYVRREIRTLTDEDREELLDAMYKMWVIKVNGDDAVELYGDDYADIYQINRLHYAAASGLRCDHFHDGMGFLTSHSLLSNTFEYSLQRINPKLALPYWDFTIEPSSSGGGQGSETVDNIQTNSPMFSSAWFGSFDPVDNMVKDGRWGNMEIARMGNNSGLFHPDVYGNLRAPWNVNDKPFLTRGMGKMCGTDVTEIYAWPTCALHYQLATGFSDFYSWIWSSLYDPHGPVHIWIGGVLECDETYGKISELLNEDAAKSLGYFSFVHRKDMYRAGIYKCVGSAPLDESPDEIIEGGQCGCMGYDLDDGDDYQVILDELLMAKELLGDVPSDVKRQVVRELCASPMVEGDHLQASSSFDPTFWVVHPTMERLWMFSVLTGQITDYTWPDHDVTYTNNEGETVSELLNLFDEPCTGHRGSDVFPFGLLNTSNASGYGGAGGEGGNFKVKTGIRTPGANAAGSDNVTGNNLTNREVLGD